jgi:hypothetical protein
MEAPALLGGALGLVQWRLIPRCSPHCGIHQMICTYNKSTRAIRPTINNANCLAGKRRVPG